MSPLTSSYTTLRHLLSIFLLTEKALCEVKAKVDAGEISVLLADNYRLIETLPLDHLKKLRRAWVDQSSHDDVASPRKTARKQPAPHTAEEGASTKTGVTPPKEVRSWLMQRGGSPPIAQSRPGLIWLEHTSLHGQGLASSDELTPSDPMARQDWRLRLSKVLNLMLQLREYLILLATLAVAAAPLLGILTRNSAELITDCTCKCGAGAQTIEECYLEQVRPDSAGTFPLQLYNCMEYQSTQS
jgi:hypothetical protein